MILQVKQKKKKKKQKNKTKQTNKQKQNKTKKPTEYWKIGLCTSKVVLCYTYTTYLQRCISERLPTFAVAHEHCMMG